MNDCDDEDLRDDCEIEFSDLPEEEERGISGQLFRRGSHLWIRARSLVLEVSRSWTSVWRWLLSETPGNNFADGSSKEEFELEIVDLPPGRFYGVSKAFTALDARLSPRMRLWRLTMAGTTVLLALLLLLGGFPSTRDWVYNLFARPTPTYTVSLTEQISLIGSSGIGSGSPSSLQATVQVWDDGAGPGPVPGGQSCPASPVQGSTSEVGRLPARVVGFDGPRATLHLSPTPVPVSAFPNRFGWTASITLELASDYAGVVTLNGKGARDGSPLVFGIGRGSSQEQLFSLTLSTYQAMVSPGHPGLFKARRPTWNIRVYVPSAGCYFLQAAWPGGNWGINFAAGE